MAAVEPTFEEREERIRLLEKDLLECKKVEMAYRSMVESTTDSLYMMDKDCRYIFINSRHLMARLNLSREEVIGRFYSDFHAPEESVEFANTVKEVFSRGISIQREHKSHRDGRYFQRTFSPVRESALSPIVAVVIVSKDITERKLIEQSLENSERIYRRFINSSRHMVFLKDDQFRYMIVNANLINFLGSKEEELLGKTDFDFMPAETANKWEIVYREARKSGGPAVSEELIAGRLYELRVFPIELSDHRIGISGRIREITEERQAEKEKKKLEMQLLQAQKMEAIGTLAGGIAHDFNNLLMGIQGYTSLLLFDVDVNHPFYRKLKNIEKQVETGADLTRQLLGFARGGKYEVMPMNINEILDKTAAVFGRTKKEIIIRKKYEPRLWTVEADPGQMEQVLLNLYVNAWQAMPNGGRLYLETQNFILEDNHGKAYFMRLGRYVQVLVRDTGTGMDEQTRARLFEPFFTTKGMGRGTGLGLATVYGIIKAHGGFIDVYSEKGQGTIFKIYLPVSDKDVVKEKIPEQKLYRGKETLLLVDDEVMIIDVTRKLLETLGHRVFSATSGREAIDIYKEKKAEISLVILDMVMPEMNGGDTFDLLKEINPEVAVILSSGYSLDHQASEILKRGCRRFIQKPYSIGSLSRIIRDVLDGTENKDA